MTKFYRVQERRSDGTWQPVKGYKSERTALDMIRHLGDTTPGGTFRIITGDAYAVFDVVAMRCPAVGNDTHLNRKAAD